MWPTVIQFQLQVAPADTKQLAAAPHLTNIMQIHLIWTNSPHIYHVPLLHCKTWTLPYTLMDLFPATDIITQDQCPLPRPRPAIDHQWLDMHRSRVWMDEAAVSPKGGFSVGVAALKIPLRTAESLVAHTLTHTVPPHTWLMHESVEITMTGLAPQVCHIDRSSFTCINIYKHISPCLFPSTELLQL